MLTGAENCMRSSTAVSRNVCVPPPEAPVAPMRDGVHSRQRLQEIHHADRVPQLQAERSEVPELLRRTAEIVRRLYGVVVAHHVVAEHDVALLREIDAARRHGREHRMLQPPVVPVAVRRDNRREAAGRRGFQRAIEIAAEIVAGHRLQQHLLDGVGLILDAAEDLRMQRSLRRHRQQAGGGENLLAQVRAARLPLGERLVGPGREVRVGIRNLGVAGVLAGICACSAPQSSRIDNIRMTSRSKGPDSFDGLIHHPVLVFGVEEFHFVAHHAAAPAHTSRRFPRSASPWPTSGARARRRRAAA